MIRTSLILLILACLACLACSACDTTNQSSTVVTAPVATSVYSSPAVLTEAATQTALSADSIPVSYSIKGVAQAPEAFAPMMGQWVSTLDTDEVVHFLPGKYTSYYKGEKVVEENMTYYEVCPNACANGQGPDLPCFVIASDYDQMCFAIIKQNSLQLELNLLGSNGGILSYQRKTTN